MEGVQSGPLLMGLPKVRAETAFPNMHQNKTGAAVRLAAGKVPAPIAMPGHHHSRRNTRCASEGCGVQAVTKRDRGEECL